jgi:nicotinamide phosphoribosyltransferase
MKKPKTDGAKTSLPGPLKVIRVDGVPTVVPLKDDDPNPDGILQTVWDKGPVNVQWETFDALKERVRTEWVALPKKHDPVSQDLKDVIAAWIKEFDEGYQAKLAL